jgi:hypothetical protein
MMTNPLDDDDELLEIGLRFAVEMILREMAEDGEVVCDEVGVWHRTEKGWEVIAKDEGITRLGNHDTWESVCRQHGLGGTKVDWNG